MILSQPGIDITAAELIDKAVTYLENRPQVIPSPDTVSQPEDIRSIVAYVAHRVLQGEIEFHGLAYLAAHYYPALRGLTPEQVETAIDEALA